VVLIADQFESSFCWQLPKSHTMVPVEAEVIIFFHLAIVLSRLPSRVNNRCNFICSRETFLTLLCLLELEWPDLRTSWHFWSSKAQKGHWRNLWHSEGLVNCEKGRMKWLWIKLLGARLRSVFQLNQIPKIHNEEAEIKFNTPSVDWGLGQIFDIPNEMFAWPHLLFVVHLVHFKVVL